MRFSYQKRVPFHIEHYFETRNDSARTRLSERRLWADLRRSAPAVGTILASQSRHPNCRHRSLHSTMPRIGLAGVTDRASSSGNEAVLPDYMT